MDIGLGDESDSMSPRMALISWLNTSSRQSPTIVIEQEHLEALLLEKRPDDRDDISGSFFVVTGPLRRFQFGRVLQNQSCKECNPRAATT